jgi:hypothetical protein
VVGHAPLLGFVVVGRGIWCGKDGEQDGESAAESNEQICRG